MQKQNNKEGSEAHSMHLLYLIWIKYAENKRAVERKEVKKNNFYGLWLSKETKFLWSKLVFSGLYFGLRKLWPFRYWTSCTSTAGHIQNTFIMKYCAIMQKKNWKH